MSLKPTIQELDTCLKNVVRDWKRFALHLPEIDPTDIDIIKANVRDDVVQQKIALYNKWLKVYLDASWDDVVKALETVEENAIAKQLRDKYLINVKTKKKSPLNEQKCSPINDLLPNSSSESVPVLSDKEEVAHIEEDVVAKLDSLELSFCALTCEVKRALEEVEEKNGNIKNVVFQVQQAKSFRINSLQSVKTTDELFEAIHPHYNFLNCHLIVHIALFLCGIAKKATDYKDSIMKFMKTTKIKCFKNVLKRYHQQRKFPAQRENHYKLIEIKVENGWGDQPLLLVEILVKTLFPEKHPDELPWYDISHGSVVMTFIAFEHMTSSLIESSRKKTEFMRLIGVISLKIGDELVWQGEDGDAVLSFEDSLIRATLADNIEAVQFILQYTQVDINTRNTNRTLFNGHEEMYFSELDTEHQLKSFHAAFSRIQSNVKVDVLATTINSDANPESAINLHHDNFLNGRLLADSELLEEKQSTDELKNYIKMIDGYKRFFQVHHLQNSLLVLFSTPFPGSFEVSLTLHNVWSTCSVWYVEQLGQLIFTPTLFYQLQWFRVDRSEESVRICLLADEKIMNSLKECVSDNELQTSMLGVVSVQVDDTVMITNDYSDGYTFNEAIKLAKAKGGDDISDLLQHMFLSPVEYENNAMPKDKNNNLCFIPHPDSTSLMIACCNDNSQLVRLLLDHNADPNMQFRSCATALMYSTGNTRIFQLLLRHGADVNKIEFSNTTAMHFACAIGNVKNVKTLKEKDQALINIKDHNGALPFHIATKYGSTAVVELLLPAHADPNIQDNRGRTALETASRNGHTAVVELLLQAKANPNTQDNEGRTALQVASRYGYTAIVELLLLSKADPNIQDCKGRTALHFARYGEHTEVTALLLQAGADDKLRLKEGCTVEVKT